MSAHRRAVIVAARRTAVAPRGGALSQLQADELAAPVLKDLVGDAALPLDRVDHVILGNALYGGGNPARLAALRAGIPGPVPSMTLDTQCCSGLDAILTGAQLIEAGAADCVLAGGAESFSRAPIRMRRPTAPGEEAVPYDRPAFAPPPFEDPDLSSAAAKIAVRYGLTRKSQTQFAQASHAKALAAAPDLERHLVGNDDRMRRRDGFTRRLDLRIGMRAPLLAGPEEFGLSAATIACEADGAAGVLLMSDCMASTLSRTGLLILGGMRKGGDPNDPALVPVAAAKALLSRLNMTVADLAAVELMEAYASQAMATVNDLSLDTARLNQLGGALARGHPIGASGAILVVQLFEFLRTRENATEAAQDRAMALIAAAGGLGSALVVERFRSKDG
ncbi:thiolase family protein [uncultured Roseibium sp.]|uniref:thiolase family protein n=1 Tax=uncultured Roseibium sp. TaxID=1936171 RepID=UPI002617B4F9|nr:thiolase family protein [uncultured Roseibium sp.]